MAAAVEGVVGSGGLTPDELDRYADAIVGACLLVDQGELLVVRGEPAHRPLVVALAEAAYRRGARHVDPWYADPLVRRARIAHAPDEALGVLTKADLERYRSVIGDDCALASITGEEQPDVFRDLPADRVSEDLRRPSARLRFFMRAQSEERVRFCVVAWPTPAWAQRVYDELPADEALQRLAADLLFFCRLGPDDGEGTATLDAHLDTLVARAEALTARPVAHLEFRGPGTSLDVGLAEGTQWLTARAENAYGQRPCVNLPTEEIFTSPHAALTEGTFRCSRPLSLAGRMIEGIAGEFRRGRLVGLEAARDDDRDLLASYLDADRTARRLGEVALVAPDNRIGSSGRIYHDTLIDENAASHIAFGFGFALAVPSTDGRQARSINASRIHLDVMIGNPDVEIHAVERGGARVPVVAGGEWCLPG